MIVGLALFTQLAAACAPQVSAVTLAAVAGAESRFESLAIQDDTAGRSYTPATAAAAAAISNRLIRRHHSVDLGLMQVNSHNLQMLGLTVEGAFDACRSIAAGGRMLELNYIASHHDGGEQMALREALSRYNTGNGHRGFTNGYVRFVDDTARVTTPALGQVAAGEAPILALPQRAAVRQTRHVRRPHRV